jgi:hypothetical protein
MIRMRISRPLTARGLLLRARASLFDALLTSPDLGRAISPAFLLRRHADCGRKTARLETAQDYRQSLDWPPERTWPSFFASHDPGATIARRKTARPEYARVTV